MKVPVGPISAPPSVTVTFEKDSEAGLKKTPGPVLARVGDAGAAASHHAGALFVDAKALGRRRGDSREDHHQAEQTKS